MTNYTQFATLGRHAVGCIYVFCKKMTNYKVIALYNVDFMENTVVLKLLSINQLQILHGASKDLFNAH